MRSSTRQLGFAALSAPLLLLGANIQDASAQKSEDTLRWASQVSLSTPDPYFNYHREAMILNGQLVWDTLLYKKADGSGYEPLLAESWEWLDDTTIEFKLRDDVQWHDGEQFTAEDVVYTYNYISNPDNGVNVQSNVNWIDHAEAVDMYTVRVHLDEPFPPALEYVSTLHAMLPKGFFGDDGTAGANGRMLGTGPYELVDFAPGESITVELSDNYFEGSPKGQPTIERIEYSTIPDVSTQMAELLSGGLDWIWRIPKDQGERLGQMDGVDVYPEETMRVSFLSMNLREMEEDNPLQDIRIRQAIAHAIDRELIVEQVIGEGSSVAYSPCYRTQFGCIEGVQRFEYDPEKSKELLEEAGYEDGLELDFVAYRDREWTEAVAGFLSEVGIETNVDFLQYQAVQERVANNQAHLFMGDWGSYGIGDVSAILNNFFTLSENDMAQDEEVSEALLAATKTVDTEQRMEYYDFAVNRIADELYWQPLWVHPVLYAHSSELELETFPDENPRFYRARWAD